MRNFSTFLIIAVSCCSCLNQKYLAKHQVVFKVEDAGNGKSEIKAYNTGNNKLRVEFIDSGGALLIQKTGTQEKDFILPTIVESSFSTTAKYQQLAASGMYYFPETSFPQPGDAFSNNLFVTPKKLEFTENNIVTQILTIPLKIRPVVYSRRLKDSIHTQALAELNIGFAAGLKRTWSFFSAYPTDDGIRHINRVSLSGSGFLSVGGTNVTPIATRNYLMYDKTEPIVSGGINVLFGWQNINIGFSVGKDHVMVSSVANKWLFDGKWWYGITLAYDMSR